MGRKVRYALVGFGGIAENRLAREGFGLDRSRFDGLAEAELIGAFDVNPDRRGAAEALQLRWYPSLAAVWQDEEVEAVFIATNNLSHAPLALEALDRQRHLIVEKPLATTAAAAEEVCERAAAAGLSLSVDHMMVYQQLNVRARQMAADGTLGDIDDACFHMEFSYGYEAAEAASWRCSRPEELGGPIGDVATHCFYLAEDLLQQSIVEVAAVYYPRTMRIAAENGALIRLALADGRNISVRVSFCDRRGGLAGTLGNLGYELYGSKAVLRGYGTMFQLSGAAGEPFQPRLELEKDGKVTILRPSAAGNIYQAVIRAHAGSILSGQPLDGRGAVHNLRVCEAAHASARAGGEWRRVDGC